MDKIVAVLIFFAALALQFFGRQLGWKILTNSRPFMSKLTVAFLIGFAGFIVFTPRIESWVQKVAIALITLFLVWANLFMVEQKD